MLKSIKSFFRVIGNKWGLLNEQEKDYINLNMTILTLDEDTEDTSKGQINVTEEQAVIAAFADENNTVHSADDNYTPLSRRNCDEVFAMFTECVICLQPLQHCGPCACPLCGGMWCERCARRLTKCPWCRNTFNGKIVPSQTLIRLVNNLELPCRNHMQGCKELLTSDSRVRHEEDCKFDSIQCFLSLNCTSMLYEDLADHLGSCHSMSSSYARSVKIILKGLGSKMNYHRSYKQSSFFTFLNDKNAFLSKICVKRNNELSLKIRRLKLGYIADRVLEKKNSKYFATVMFECKSIGQISAVLVENNVGGKRSQMTLNKKIVISNDDEEMCVCINLIRHRL